MKPEVEDKLLREFHLNTRIHENAISHAKEKGFSLADCNIFFQPECWDILANMIRNEEYHTQPTTVRYLDKKTGQALTYAEATERQMKEVREIYVMEPVDRVIWNAIYQVLYNRFENLIHPLCCSYKKGESTRSVAKKLNRSLVKMVDYRGTKNDIVHYFDSVPIKTIDKLFDKLETLEPSCLWTVVREFYHDNRVIINGQMVERYCSLKQGCAVSAFLSDLILSEVDEMMANQPIVYYRYSDDCIILGKGIFAMKARYKMEQMLNEIGLEFNPKKTEYITNNKWFTFLGFKFKEDKITVSMKTLKNIVHQVKMSTIVQCKNKKRPLTNNELKKAIRDIQYYFFEGCDKCSAGMAGYLFGACNIEEDIATLDSYIKDCLRACKSNKCNIGGLGASYGNTGVVRAKGRNVSMNMVKTKDDETDLLKELGWKSLTHMYKKYRCGKEVYQMEVLNMGI